jgi:hypothetical protein
VISALSAGLRVQHVIDSQRRFGIINRLLTENVAIDGLVSIDPPDPRFVYREFRWGDPSKKIRRKSKNAPWKSPRAQQLTMSGGKDGLFSRLFVRKRLILLAATATVGRHRSLGIGSDGGASCSWRDADPICGRSIVWSSAKSGP